MLQETNDFIRIVSRCPPTNWTLNRLSITSIRSIRAARLLNFYRMQYLHTSNWEIMRRKKTSIQLPLQDAGHAKRITTTAHCYLYTVIAELHMPDEFFCYWSERPPTPRHLLILINLSSCSRSTGYICRAELLKILQLPSLLQGIHRNRSKGNHLQLTTCRKKRTALFAMTRIICSICVMSLKQNHRGQKRYCF